MPKHSCPTCKSATEAEGHLCSPKARGDKKCEWCGNVIPNERHLCEAKVRSLTYICNSCGRTAVRPEYLCQPEKISKGTNA